MEHNDRCCDLRVNDYTGANNAKCSAIAGLRKRRVALCRMFRRSSAVATSREDKTGRSQHEHRFYSTPSITLFWTKRFRRCHSPDARGPLLASSVRAVSGPVIHFVRLDRLAEAILGFGGAAYVVIATTITAIARTTPRSCAIFAWNRERCVSDFTLRWLSKKCNVPKKNPMARHRGRRCVVDRPSRHFCSRTPAAYSREASMSASDKLSTKCSGLLLRSSFAILAARTRHLISVAPMPAFSFAFGLSNSSDIILKDMCLLPPLVIRADERRRVKAVRQSQRPPKRRPRRGSV